MSTCNPLDLETLGRRPIIPNILPGHCSECRVGLFWNKAGWDVVADHYLNLHLVLLLEVVLRI